LDDRGTESRPYKLHVPFKYVHKGSILPVFTDILFPLVPLAALTFFGEAWSMGWRKIKKEMLGLAR
jgi:hypothetical protein